MKVLVFAPYIYDKGHREFERNKTGFGMMVNDICRSVGATENVYLYTHVFTKGYLKEFSVLPHSFFHLIMGFSHLISSVRYAFEAKGVPLKTRARLCYYSLSVSSFLYYYKKLSPDIVHIHGGTLTSLPIIRACKKKHIPFVLTLHGTVCDLPHVPQYNKDAEKESFVCSEYVTVISSGIKKRLCALTGKTGEHVFVVNNGVSLQPSTGIDIRTQYDIPKENKIILSVGNISPWKNQLQTIRALSLMKKEDLAKITFLIVGINVFKTDIEKVIIENNLSDIVKLAGFVPHDILSDYYRQCDCVVLASTEEGFGLSVAEGYLAGKPGVFFSDIDAANELYSENVAVMPEGRNDEDLKNAIEKNLDRSWNEDVIKQWAERFSLEAMKNKYLDVYGFGVKQ